MRQVTQLPATDTTDVRLVVDGSQLTITDGGLLDIQSFDAINGSVLRMTGTNEVRANDRFVLGDAGAPPNFATMSIEGDTRASGRIEEGTPGLGVVHMSNAGGRRLRVENGDTLEIVAGLENDGVVEVLDGTLFLIPRASAPSNDGAFTVAAGSTLHLQPVGTSIELSGSASLSGAGEVRVGPTSLPGAATPGEVNVAANATVDVGELTLLGPHLFLLDGDGSVGRLTMAESAERRGSGELDVTGPGRSSIESGTLSGSGTTSVFGPLDLEGVVVDGGATLVTAGATTAHGGDVRVEGGGVLRNVGSLTVPGGADAGLAGRLDHDAGTLSVNGRIVPAGGTAPSVEQTGGTTFVSGELQAPLTLLSGDLLGTGTVASLANTGGFVRPGASPGTLRVAGDYSQGRNATLLVEIAGAATHDVLEVGGTASLDGALLIESGSFVPALTDTFRILRAGARGGTWFGIGGADVGVLRYVDTYQSDGATLTVLGPPGPPPPPVILPSPPATIPPATARFGQLARLPSTRRCVSRRRFRIRLRHPAGTQDPQRGRQGERQACAHRARRAHHRAGRPARPAEGPRHRLDHDPSHRRADGYRQAPLSHLRDEEATWLATRSADVRQSAR